MPDWPASRELPIIYMFCGATQHSNTEPFDKTSPYAYLHICGTPWAGKRVHPQPGPGADDAVQPADSAAGE